MTSKAELIRCDGCCKEFDPADKDARITNVYHPFEDEPDVFHYCPECSDGCDTDTFFCESCGRDIYESNGMRINGHVLQGEMVCARCIQEEFFEKGEPTHWHSGGKIKGEWYNDSDLRAHGFTREIESRFIGGSAAANKFNVEVQEHARTNKVIVSIVNCGMGLEGSVDLWIKPREQKRKDNIVEMVEVQAPGYHPEDREHSSV